MTSGDPVHEGARAIGVTNRGAGVFAILVTLMIANHLDRQVVVSILPLLKSQLETLARFMALSSCRSA
jgi:hypothetical protein